MIDTLHLRLLHMELRSCRPVREPTLTPVHHKGKQVVFKRFHSLEHPPVRVPSRAFPCYRQWPTSLGRAHEMAPAPAGGTVPSSPRTILRPGPGSDSSVRSLRGDRVHPGPAGRATAAAGSTMVTGGWSWCWTGRRGGSRGHWTAGKRWAGREAGSTGAGNPYWPNGTETETDCRGADWLLAGEAAGGSHCCCRRAFPEREMTRW